MFKEIWNNEESMNRISDMLEIGIAVLVFSMLVWL